MEFKRELTKEEVDVLGADPEQCINSIIDHTLSRLTNSDNAFAKFLSVMSNTEAMSVRQIYLAYNTVYTATPASLAYARFITSELHKIGIVKMVRRGQYMKMT